jgi:hypothetical protein
MMEGLFKMGRLTASSSTFIALFFPGQVSLVEAFCCQVKSFSAARPSYFREVAVYGKDRRRTVKEYAQDNGFPASAVMKQFAATGTITCHYHGPCFDLRRETRLRAR